MDRIVAVFDVDQTLIQGSTERRFFRYLVHQGLLRVPRALSYLGGLARHPQERFRDKSYLRGLPVEDILGQAQQC